jgi:hypothetical protein
MKKPTLSIGLRRIAASALLGGRRLPLETVRGRSAAAGLVALSLLGAACASGDQRLSDAAQPSMPGMAAPGTVFGLPGDGSEGTPASTPPVNDGPGATETNFLTPPCGDGSRLIPDAGSADAGEDGAVSGGLLAAGGPAAGAGGSAAGDAGAPDGARVPCAQSP